MRLHHHTATIRKVYSYMQNCPAATIGKGYSLYSKLSGHHYWKHIFFIFRTVRPPLLEREDLVRAAAVGFYFRKVQNPCRFCFKECDLWLYGLSWEVCRRLASISAYHFWKSGTAWAALSCSKLGTSGSARSAQKMAWLIGSEPASGNTNNNNNWHHHHHHNNNNNNGQ